MKKSKKIIIGIIITIIVIAAGFATVTILKKNNKNKKTADVYSASEVGYTYYGSIMGNESMSGNVAINTEQKIYLSSTDKVEEVCVSEGDVVKAGDILMKYDVTAQNLQLELLKTEVELARVAILTAQRELKELQNTTPVDPTTEAPTTEEPTTEEPTTEDPTATPSDATDEPTTEEPTTEDPTVDDGMGGDPDEITYTKEELERAIKEKKNEITSLNTNYQLKLVEYEIKEHQNPNGEVLCNFDGVVKSIAPDKEEAILNNEPYIVVGPKEGYTVKSYIGELKMMTVGVGDNVSMFSYDNGMNYTGVITEISDMPIEGYNNYDGTTQSYYPMTIALDDTTDVRVGMYMEITVDDFSMDESSMDDPSTQKKTFTLMAPFIMKENGNSYVMKEVNGRLEKTYIMTGKTYWGSEIEILGGVTEDDYIAFPYSSSAIEGVKTVHKSADSMYY